MYFKRLELVGFKSFCDKTSLEFEPGITAVVGPNGCGKSNIFDSIRWVLGEQSAKSLRGADMQDVIFNGTDAKDPLGMAEVTLAFDNRQRFFSFDHDEVAVTRRLFRSGESEYLLNKAPVRLKDILDLLLGTGVGAESYSIVAQGKIDLVLSSRPEDRRLVFDEASGITKYKAQKRETARKIEETEQNLLRVSDIITEVKRQIGSLERQASKARRYKEAFDELKVKEIQMSVLQKKKIIEDKDAIIEQLKGLESSEAALLTAIEEQEARIANRAAELKALEDRIMATRNEVLGLQNTAARQKGQIDFNREQIATLSGNARYMETQAEQLKIKIAADEETLVKVRQEFETIKAQIDQKQGLLSEKELEINALAERIKQSLETITQTKRNILDIASAVSHIKNELNDFTSKQQVHIARSKRLEIEKAKVFEEKALTEESLKNITQEVHQLAAAVDDTQQRIAAAKVSMDQEAASLSQVVATITGRENERLTLQSHKEFLEKLKTKYEDIGESLNAVIYLDKLPRDNVSGLVVKIKDQVELNDADRAYMNTANFKLVGEAKPMELDTEKINAAIQDLESAIAALKEQKSATEARIAGLNSDSASMQQELRAREIALANKETQRETVHEQFTKIQEEEDLIVLELNDVHREISVYESNIASTSARLTEMSEKQRQAESLISSEEYAISLNSKAREDVLVVITQTKTELDALTKRAVTDEETLKIIEETQQSNRNAFTNTQNQIQDNYRKVQGLAEAIGECEKAIAVAEQGITEQNLLLVDVEAQYGEISTSASDVSSKIEADRQQLDSIKDKLYELQMKDKDLDYRYNSIRERMLAAYKIDIETADQAHDEGLGGEPLNEAIAKLKEKVESYGSVNLVAIEEYDELKQRYDFLVQQQTDLLTAKESLHQAILKINRTTRQMFLETFEKVREEFKNYFRLLFNGGDAQVFLTDESDPLESGIEIICRPPGKKLQNVLLLSGGEKSMSAIALIFAIFKVKPSPFCILDEIDAALDEANVDRFARMLQEFAKQSQFIVITHNKRTIANADVMYGITMQESGVSKIVSVKFAKNAAQKEAEASLDTAVAESV